MSEVSPTPPAEPTGTGDPSTVSEQLALDALRSKMLGRAGELRRLGRYEIQQRIGQGGMGVVYRAYDPSLRRTVALKLVTGSRGRRTARRIIREAQSQARLTHPNVVEVYDVGASGIDVYITMELVDGPSLLEWLTTEPPRPWRAVLEVFRATARGLIAAHQAGLVHRDFKPANVLFTKEGRPKVADFGLAIRSQDTTQVCTSADAAQLDTRSPRLTQTGSVMGTPLYMAPEQHRAERVDAKADQFAFCVALFEALFGTPPFPATKLEDLARLKHAGCRPPPDRRGVPRLVLAALVRGLKPQPDQRWPSMSALLVELETAARPRRIWLAGWAVVALALSGLALGQRDDRDPCSTDLLDASWSDDRARIDAVFEESATPHARQGWASVRTGLDAYVDAWSSAFDEVCNDDARQEPGDVRLRCLRQRQRRFEALALVMSRPGVGALAEPGMSMAGLESPADCLDADQGDVGEGPDDPRFAAIDARVAEAEALTQTRWLDDARVVATDAFDQAHAAGFDTLEARASLQLGITHVVDDDPQAARPHLEHAYFLADASGDHFTAAVAASKVVFALSVGDGSEADAGRWAEHAMAHLERMDDDGPIGVVELSVGLMWHRRGDYAEAAVHEMRAAEAFASVNHPDHPLVADALSNAGNAYVFAGEIERGLEVLGRAARIYETAYGRDSPKRAATVVNIGLGHYRAGRYSDALPHFDEALEIVGVLPSSERRLRGQALVNRALCLTALGEHDQALADLMEARELILAAVGADHSLMAMIDMNIGLIHFNAGRVEDGLQFYERALATQIASLGADHPDVALTEHNIGVSLNSLGRYGAAEGHLQRSSASFEATLGKDADYTALSEMELARALDGLERYAEALELVTRALRILESKGAQPSRFVVMASMYRGRTLRKLRRFADAQSELDGALSQARALVDDDPVLSTELFLERGRLAVVQGDRAVGRLELIAARKLALTNDEAKGLLADIDAELRGARQSAR